MRWLVVVSLVACSRNPDSTAAKPAGSASPPVHVTSATPTITTIPVHDFLAQATGGGSAWSLRHVRVRGQLDAVTRDASGCITAVTLREGDQTVQCVLVDPSPIPLHAVATVDAQVSVEGATPSLIHCRVMAPPGKELPLEPACTSGSAEAPPTGSAAR
jgi:hypothetical protein